MTISNKETNEYMDKVLKPEFENLAELLMLSDIEKTIIRLKYRDKITIPEIATAIHKSKGYVADRLLTFRIKLSKTDIYNKKKFDVTTASEYEIRQKCEKLGKNKQFADFCILAFHEKLSNKELAEKYCLTIKTVKEYKRLRKQLLQK